MANTQTNACIALQDVKNLCQNLVLEWTVQLTTSKKKSVPILGTHALAVLTRVLLS